MKQVFFTLKIVITILAIGTFGTAYAQKDAANTESQQHLCTECITVNGEQRLPGIKNSTNDMEIRYIKKYHGEQYMIVVITLKNSVYSANYYSGTSGLVTNRKTGNVIGSTPLQKYPITDHDLDSVVTALKDLQVFTLPDRYKLDLTSRGVYIIEYKLNDIFKTYNFYVSKELIEKYPNSQEYKDYQSITDLFYKLSAKAHNDMQRE